MGITGRRRGSFDRTRSRFRLRVPGVEGVGVGVRFRVGRGARQRSRLGVQAGAAAAARRLMHITHQARVRTHHTSAAHLEWLPCVHEVHHLANHITQVVVDRPAVEAVRSDPLFLQSARPHTVM